MRTIRPSTFATGNYPAGARPWNGQPRQIPLSAAQKAAGLVPDEPVGAPRLNALHDEHFAAQSVQAIGALQTWQRADVPGVTDERLCWLVAPSNPSRRQRFVVGLGLDISLNQVAYLRSLGAGTFEASIQKPGQGAPYCVASGASGEFLAASAGNLHRYNAIGTAAVDTVNFFTDLPSAVHYAEFASRYLVTTNTGLIYSYPTFASPVLATGPAGLTAFAASASTAAGGEFADDGTANIVHAGSSTVSGVTRFRILHSADGGATWAVAHTFGAGLTCVNVAWLASAQGFVALCSNGDMYLSFDGSSWAILTNTSITVANGASDRHGSMAVQGHAIAKLYNTSVYGFPQGGLVFTFDAGETWHAWGVTDPDAFGGVNAGAHGLVGANGRFYLTDRRSVYTSGVVASGEHDFT